MALEADIGGAAEALRAMAAKIERAGHSELYAKATREGIEEVVPQLVRNVRANAKTTLPNRGGLADIVAGLRISARPWKLGIRLTAQPNSKIKDPAAINRGRIKHPTHGHRPWVIQQVPPGWFTTPLREGKPIIRRAIARALSRALERI